MNIIACVSSCLRSLQSSCVNSWFCMFRTGVYCDSVNNLLTSVVSWLRLSGSSRLIVFIFGLTITVLNLVIALCMIICVES